MILSVSRRTDIPAFYSEWFFNRIKEGFVYVRNPMNRHQVSKIVLSPDVIDCIVFWTKNPKPMLCRLDELNGYMYYFQFTINPYDHNMESNVPIKKDVIETFVALSDRIGSKRMVWRYDPILLTDKMDVDYHVRYFEEIAKRLEGHVETCVISFVDLYKKTQRNLKGTTARELSGAEVLNLTPRLLAVAQRYGIAIQTCAEEIALEKIGVNHGRCIDNILIEDLLGVKLVVSKDANQRKECGCVQSIDIGEYNTCSHNCKYCYANFDSETVAKNRQIHNPQSPLLIGELYDDDKVSERKLFSFIKVPEPLHVGDLVKLKHPESYMKETDIHCHRINVFRIKGFVDGAVKLDGVKEDVPLAEMSPIGIDGIEDRWIYYDPVIAATMLFEDGELASHTTDYSYYWDAFERCDVNGKTLRSLLEKKKVKYVHEVQHYLSEKFHRDDLKINDCML